MNDFDKNKCLKDFNEIYYKYKNVVYCLIVSKVEDESIHEDLFQEIMLKVYNYLCTCDITKHNIKNWIYTITINHIKDYYKSIDKIEIHYDFNMIDNMPNNNYKINATVRDLRYVLSDFEYDLFVCYYIIGMSMLNISKRMGIPYTMCKNKLKEIHYIVKKHFNKNSRR